MTWQEARYLLLHVAQTRGTWEGVTTCGSMNSPHTQRHVSSPGWAAAHSALIGGWNME